MRVDGKFLAAGDDRLWVRGVTYGTFARGTRRRAVRNARTGRARLRGDGAHGHQRRSHVHGAAAVAARRGAAPWAAGSWSGCRGSSTSRSSTTGAGAAAIESIACASRPPAAPDIRRSSASRSATRSRRRSSAGTAAAASSGSSSGCATAVRAEDSGALLTYVNYPSTEYLRLPFLDFLSFNVYLDDCARRQPLPRPAPEPRGREAAAARGARRRQPSRQGPTARRTRSARRSTPRSAAGCAGTFVFAWTDEWHRGDDEVLDWDFGVTDRERRPKPALDARCGGATPTAGARRSRTDPVVSVIVCTHNGARDARRTASRGSPALRYPAYEMIVVDDGSTDAQRRDRVGVRRPADPHREPGPERRPQCRPRRRPRRHRRLHRRRRLPRSATGFASSRGVPHRPSHAASAGPNLPPADDGAIAACVANAPGGPVHVLVSDTEAEHIPGCNMAYRRDDAARDRRLRSAVPGRRRRRRRLLAALQERGRSLGFHPAAVVWHRRRSSIRALSGGSSAATARPRRCSSASGPRSYNRRGHLTWAGRLYDRASASAVRPDAHLPRHLGHRRLPAARSRLAEARSPSSSRRPTGTCARWPRGGLGSLGRHLAELFWVRSRARRWPLGASLAMLALAALGADLGRHGDARPRRLAPARGRRAPPSTAAGRAARAAPVAGPRRRGAGSRTAGVAVPVAACANCMVRDLGRRPATASSGSRRPRAVPAHASSGAGRTPAGTSSCRAGRLAPHDCSSPSRSTGADASSCAAASGRGLAGGAHVAVIAGCASRALLASPAARSAFWRDRRRARRRRAWECGLAVARALAAMRRATRRPAARADAAVERRAGGRVSAAGPARVAESGRASPEAGMLLHAARKRERGPWWTWLPLLRQALRYARPYWHLIARVARDDRPHDPASACSRRGRSRSSSTRCSVRSRCRHFVPGRRCVVGSDDAADRARHRRAALTVLENAITVAQRVRHHAARPVDGARPAKRPLPARASAVAELLRGRADRHAHVPDQRPGELRSARSIVALPPVLQSVVTLGGMFFIAYRIDPTLALLSLSVVPVIYASLGYYARRVEPRLVNARAPRGPVALDRPRGDLDAARDRHVRPRGVRRTGASARRARRRCRRASA